MLAHLLYQMSVCFSSLCLFLQSSSPQTYLQMMTQLPSSQVPALAQHYLCPVFHSIISAHLASELDEEEKVLLGRAKHNIITSLSTVFLVLMQS